MHKTCVLNMLCSIHAEAAIICRDGRDGLICRDGRDGLICRDGRDGCKGIYTDNNYVQQLMQQ